MSKTHETKAAVSNFKQSAIEKSLRKKTARLKSSGWYDKAARSIGISSKNPTRQRNDTIEHTRFGGRAPTRGPGVGSAR